MGLSPTSCIRQTIRSGLSLVLPPRLPHTRGPRHSKSVCLTFDDGPHPEHTPRLLDRLAELNVPATFFLIGQEAEKYPDIVRRLVAEGHAIGNHTYSHPVRETLSARQAARKSRRDRRPSRESPANW